MEAFDEDAYIGATDGGEENVHDGAMQYGFDGESAAEPPPPPPLPADGLLRSPMKRDNMRSSETYGYGGSPDAYNSPSPFDNAGDGEAGGGEDGGGGDDYKKPYDLAADDDGIFTSGGGDGPLLPDPSQMREEGTAFREWRRQNMIYLEEKEKKEKEMRNQILAEADEWKRKFYEKRTQTCETNRAQNREREKLYYAQQEKFHKEADNQFWKAIADIIPREVPNIEKRRSKKEDDKKPSINVVQGPKPGKPTDMSRMRQILAKLKVKPPLHMVPPPPEKDKKDEKDGKDDKEGKDGKTATPKGANDGKDKKEGAPSTPSSAGGKPVPPAKSGTPESAKADEATGDEGKESVQKEA